MISGTLMLLAGLIAANPPPASTPTPDVAALVARLAKPAPADTAYVEVRYLSVLNKPLVLHGGLHYGGPGELGKRVDSPYRESTTISAGQVDVARGGRPDQHFSLERAPELQAMLAAFGALLGGDADTLQRYYETDLQQQGAHFTLVLTPRLPALARHLRRVVVDGSGSEPQCFSMQQSDGDASIMLLGAKAEAALPQPPTRAALAALCAAPAQ